MVKIYHYLVRYNDNKVYCGDSSVKLTEINKILFGLNIIDIKCGRDQSLVLTASGEVYAWGLIYFDAKIDGFKKFLDKPIKLIGFDNKKVVMISCGYYHSLALTDCGHVYSWGLNWDGQLGIRDIKYTTTFKMIDLENVVIAKISCGRKHSLILSDDGVIYAFGHNFWGQLGNGKHERLQLIPTKLVHKQKFIDIASHQSLNISISLSADHICYVWGESEYKYNYSPIETHFRTIAEVFNALTPIHYEPSEEFIEFSDSLFRFGYYNERYVEEYELGRGSFGIVFKTKKINGIKHAIKKIIPMQGSEKEFAKEFNNFITVRQLLDSNIAQHSDAWYENDFKNNNLIFYLEMELCDTTLESLIEELDSDSKFKNQNEEMLTPIGYFIASQLFIELVEGLQYLHKENIIHRDLKPSNILLKNGFLNSNLLERDYKRRFLKISDFGLLALHRFSQQTHSLDKGTPKYMAPEVIYNEKYGFEADIYSIGVILTQLLIIDMSRYEQ